MNEKYKEKMLLEIKVVFHELIERRKKKLLELSKLKNHDLNPLLDRHKALFLFGNESKESLARALIYPSIIGTGLNTSFGQLMQKNYLTKFENVTASGIKGLDIEFDDSIIDYATLLRVFFTAHDPTQLNRQGNDIGPQYRSIVFVDGVEERNTLNSILKEVSDWFRNEIVTEVAELAEHTVYPAEVYHFDYFANNPQNPYCTFVVAPKVYVLLLSV